MLGPACWSRGILWSSKVSWFGCGQESALGKKDSSEEPCEMNWENREEFSMAWILFRLSTVWSMQTGVVGVRGTPRSMWMTGYRTLDVVQQSETEVMYPDQRDEAEAEAAVSRKVGRFAVRNLQTPSLGEGRMSLSFHKPNLSWHRRCLCGRTREGGRWGLVRAQPATRQAIFRAERGWHHWSRNGERNTISLRFGVAAGVGETSQKTWTQSLEIKDSDKEVGVDGAEP